MWRKTLNCVGQITRIVSDLKVHFRIFLHSFVTFSSSNFFYLDRQHVNISVDFRFLFAVNSNLTLLSEIVGELLQFNHILVVDRRFGS